MSGRLASEAEVETWRTDGWVLLDSLVGDDDIEAGLHDLHHYFPTAAKYRANPDRYGRSVCKVMVAPSSCTREPCARTMDAGLAMLTLGLAWWEPQYAREQTPQERGQYEFAEYEAKGKHAGLWTDGDPVAPWIWRQQHPHPRW